MERACHNIRLSGRGEAQQHEGKVSSFMEMAALLKRAAWKGNEPGTSDTFKYENIQKLLVTIVISL